MSLERATYILLTPGIRARNTETIAIEDAKTIKKENSANLLTSIATRRGVFEFIISSGLIIESVNQVTTKYNNIVIPRPVNIAVGIISLGFFIGSIQSSSRTALITVSSEKDLNQMFGLYAVSGKVTNFLGPMLVASFTLYFESQRAGMASILIFLIVGLLLLRKTKI